MATTRKLLAVVLTLMPVTAHVACAASNGDAIPPEIREAGALEASNGSRLPDDDDEDVDDAGTRDGSKDAAKDARTGGDASVPTIVINEVYVDIDGLGDGAEFVELRAEPGTLVDDLKLRIIDGDGVVKYTVAVADPGETVGGTGYWVVGGNQTFKLGVLLDRVDQPIPLAGWGLPTDRGAVQLVRGTKIVDVVSWSTDPDAGPIPPPPPPAITGEGSPAEVPTIKKTNGKPAHSFGRQDQAPDTDDNRADFCSMEVSPGFEQNPCD